MGSFPRPGQGPGDHHRGHFPAVLRGRVNVAHRIRSLSGQRGGFRQVGVRQLRAVERPARASQTRAVGPTAQRATRASLQVPSGARLTSAAAPTTA